LNVEAQESQAITAGGSRHVDADPGRLLTQGAATARFEFLFDGDGQFLVVEKRWAILLGERKALRVDTERRVRPFARADHIGFGDRGHRLG